VHVDFSEFTHVFFRQQGTFPVQPTITATTLDGVNTAGFAAHHTRKAASFARIHVRCTVAQCGLNGLSLLFKLVEAFLPVAYLFFSGPCWPVPWSISGMPLRMVCRIKLTMRADSCPVQLATVTGNPSRVVGRFKLTMRDRAKK